MVKIAIGDQRLLGELISPAKRPFILLLCDLEDKFRATAEAGYDRVSLILNNIERYLEQKHSSEEIVSLLDKYQIPVSEFGYTFEWHY
jgi:hypothetical protein